MSPERGTSLLTRFCSARWVVSISATIEHYRITNPDHDTRLPVDDPHLRLIMNIAIPKIHQRWLVDVQGNEVFIKLEADLTLMREIRRLNIMLDGEWMRTALRDGQELDD